MRIAALLLLLTGASAGLTACRLGANNSEKLSALKSGEIYDEDGVVSIAITSPEAGTLINVASDSSTYAASGTCGPDGVEISLLVDEVLDTSATAAVCLNGSWTSSFNSQGLAGGAHSLSAVANKEGKTKTSEAVAFTKDTSVPQLAILSPSNNSYIGTASNSATFGVSGTCSETGQSVSVKIDGSAAASQVGGSCNGATWAATVSTLGLSVGVHTFTVSMTSGSGNTSVSDPVVVTKDLTAPTVAITAPGSGSYIYSATSVANYNVSGSCNDLAAQVQVRVDGTGSGWTDCVNGTNFGQSISTAALSEGTHTLTAVVQDPAGNTSTSSAITITKDVTAPTISITAPTANSYVNLGNNSATFAISGSCSGAADSGRGVTVQLNGANSTQSAISCGAGNTWSGTFSTAALSDATHTLTAVISDVAGNSTTSSAVAVIKDSVRPTVTLTHPVANLVINPNTISAAYGVQGTCSENTRAVSVLVDGAAASGLASNTCASGAFSATIDVTGLSNAAHTISVTQTDAAGNTNTTIPSAAVTQDSTLSMAPTFTRTSVAHDPYTGVQAASGVARYSLVDGSTGVMVEDSSSNLLLRSSEFTNAAWINISSAFTLTADAGTAPDGNTTATRFQAAGGAYFARAQSFSFTAGTTYTFSVWLKSYGGGNETFRIAFFDSTTTECATYNLMPVTGSWQRFSVTGTCANSGTGYVRLSSVSTGVAIDVLVWGAQLEAKPYMTSYLATTSGTVSRGTEALSLPVSGNILPSQGAGVVRVYVSPQNDLTSRSGSHGIFEAGISDTTSRVILYTYNNGAGNRLRTLICSDGATCHSSLSASATMGVGWHTVGFRWNASEASIWLNGTKLATTSGFTLPTTLGTAIKIGRGTNVSNWNAPIDYAGFYQRSPSDDEMTAYTTTGPVNADNRLDFTGGNLARSTVGNSPMNGAEIAASTPRYQTITGSTGLLIEDAATNLVTNTTLDSNITGWAYGTASGASDDFTATYNTDTAYVWQGTGSGKVERTANALPNDYRMVYLNNANYGAIGANTVYTFSFWAYVPSNTSFTRIWINDDNAVTSNVTRTEYDVAKKGTWQRMTFTFTSNSTPSKPYFLIRATGAALGDTFYFDAVQLEQKAFATSWHSSGSRGFESFSIPAKKIFTDLSQGAIAARFYLGGDMAVASPTVNHTLFDLYDGSADRLMLRMNAGGTWTSSIGNITSFASPGFTNDLTTGWHTMMLRWSSSEASIWVDGSKRASTTTVYVPSSALMNQNFFVGTHFNGAAHFFSQPIDWMALYSTSPNDTDAGAISSGTIGTPSLKLDFNQSLGQ